MISDAERAFGPQSQSEIYMQQAEARGSRPGAVKPIPTENLSPAAMKQLRNQFGPDICPEPTVKDYERHFARETAMPDLSDSKGRLDAIYKRAFAERRAAR